MLRYAAGRVLAGIPTLLLVSIFIFSLAHVLRHGYNWESSRVETAVSNLPMLSGIIYIAVGAGLAIAGS